MKDITKDLNDTLKLDNLSQISQNIGELVIDGLLEDGLAKDIPIVGSVVGLTKFGISVKDYLFLKKIAKFLFEIGETTSEQREKLIEKIEQSEKYNKDVGEALLLIIDKLDDLEKPKILGKLFKALIEFRIDYKTFLRLAFSIEKVFLPDIESLKEIKEGKQVDSEIKSLLYNAGLMKRTTFGEIQVSGDNEFEINELGNILIFEIY